MRTLKQSVPNKDKWHVEVCEEGPDSAKRRYIFLSPPSVGHRSKGYPVSLDSAQTAAVLEFFGFKG